MTTLLCIDRDDNIDAITRERLEAAGVIIVPLAKPNAAHILTVAPKPPAPRTPDEPKAGPIEDAIKARSYDERVEREARKFAHQMRARGADEAEIARAIERGSVGRLSFEDEMAGIVS